MKKLIEKLKREWERFLSSIGIGDSPSKPDTPDTPNNPHPPVTGWRTDLVTVAASNNAIEFWTKDVLPATGNGQNGDGGMEWIISRIEGSGYRRLLIMVMGGNRPPSRIYFQLNDGSSSFRNSVFSVPLAGENKWKIDSANGALRIHLNGKIIWSHEGNFGVSRAIMNGYAKRGFRGSWKL